MRSSVRISASVPARATENRKAALDPDLIPIDKKQHFSSRRTLIKKKKERKKNRANLPRDTVRRSQHVFVIDERAAAELPAGVEERGDPRPLAWIGVLSTDDTLLVLIPVFRAALREIAAADR